LRAAFFRAAVFGAAACGAAFLGAAFLGAVAFTVGAFDARRTTFLAAVFFESDFLAAGFRTAAVFLPAARFGAFFFVFFTPARTFFTGLFARFLVRVTAFAALAPFRVAALDVPRLAALRLAIALSSTYLDSYR